MKFIILTNTKERCIVDDEDYDTLTKIGKWRRLKRSVTHATHRGYIVLSRFLLNPPKGLVVDHINHNILDNRKINLRICTPQQNSWNQYKNKDNTSGYKGVTEHKKAKKWQAQSTHGRKTYYLGLYDTKEEAYKAYCKFVIERRGEFATI